MIKITENKFKQIVREEVIKKKLVEKWNKTGLLEKLTDFDKRYRASQILEYRFKRLVEMAKSNNWSSSKVRDGSDAIILASRRYLK